MGKGYLIDTNVIIDLAATRLSKTGELYVKELIQSDPCISVINKIELLGFRKVPDVVLKFVESANVLPLDGNVADKAIQLRKVTRIKLPDAVIAATALVNKKILVTRNVKDFVGIPEIDVVNPHEA